MRTVLFASVAIATLGLSAPVNADGAGSGLSQAQCREILKLGATQYKEVSKELGLEAGAYLSNKNSCSVKYPELVAFEQQNALEGDGGGGPGPFVASDPTETPQRDPAGWSELGNLERVSEEGEERIVDVPVPATGGLLLAGIAMVGLLRRRYR